MDSCTHTECNHVSGAAARLFEGLPMRMVDLSEATPGARPYGAECSTQPVAGFQVQEQENRSFKNPDTGEITEVLNSGRWFQVNMWEIKSPDKIWALNEYAARVYAEPEPEGDQPPGEAEDAPEDEE